MESLHIIAGVICLILFTVIVATFMSLSKKDSASNSKLLSIIIAFSFVSSLFSYGLAVYYFARNPEYQLQFLQALVMLVALPGTLIGVSVGSIAVSNLRDTIANS